MKDYHDLHLKIDVLLLAGVFQKFRNISLRNYGLCPSQKLIAPVLSWDAILNRNKRLLIFTIFLLSMLKYWYQTFFLKKSMRSPL